MFIFSLLVLYYSSLLTLCYLSLLELYHYSFVVSRQNLTKWSLFKVGSNDEYVE
jgi:hypothetical protein